MLAVTRHHVEPADADAFLGEARTAVAALSVRPGWRSARVARATDDPYEWVITSEWDSVGAYRRALSTYDVRVAAVPLLSRGRDEPTAYEVVLAEGLGAEGLAGPSGRTDGGRGDGPEGAP